MTLDRRAFLLSSLGAAVANDQSQARNVLFIAADDLNDDMSTFGHELVRTPNIDRLAAKGVRFDRAYCQFPLCSPSRTSLMTGLGPDATTVYDLQKHFRSVVPDVVTAPQLMQKNGGFSARVGKIYHYGNPGQIGTDGLDDAPSWNERVNPAGVDKTKEEPLLTNFTPGRGIGSAPCYYSSPAKDEEHTDGKVAAESIRIMEQHQKDRFFLGCGFYRPHVPWISPSKYFDMVPMDKLKAIPFEEWELKIAPKWAYWTTPPNFGMTEKQRLECMRAYYAAILFLDAQVGKVLDTVERLKLEQNTLIVFWSDHGYQLGEHGQWFKQTVFEPAARAPMIIAGAGVKARGKACKRTVEFVDIYPTVADMCGLRGAPANLHGKSLRPLLDNPNAAWTKPAVTQVRRGNNAKSVMGHSLRNERYRYSMWNEGAEGEELYDYDRDPREMKNLVTEPAMQDLKNKMKTQLAGIIRQRGWKGKA
ncbi:MAG: sulfatase [Bryobacteraceae bacterium]